MIVYKFATPKIEETNRVGDSKENKSFDGVQ